MVEKENLPTYFILEIANLEVDAKIGKDRHFAAADRKNKWRLGFGLFSVVGTALIASQAAKDLLSVADFTRTHLTPIMSSVSLVVGISTAILGFLGLETQIAQHRVVGNMYIEVARKARRLINQIYEGAELNAIRTEFEGLLKEYLAANKEGESCPTSKKDSKRSFEQNKEGRDRVKGKVRHQDDAALSYQVFPKKLSLRRLLLRSMRRKAAQIMTSCGFISAEERDAYIKGL